MKNPDGIIRDIDKIVEMKEIKSPHKGMLNLRIAEAVIQKPEIIICNLIRGVFKYGKRYEKLKEVWLLWDGDIIKVKK